MNETTNDMKSIRLALFASGSGTNAEQIIRNFAQDPDLHIILVVSNKSDAGVHERVARLGVPSVTLGKDVLADGLALSSFLKEHGIDAVVLAGYLLRIPAGLVEAYPGRILNIHPALLPKYGGKGMYGRHVHEAVVAAGERESGITIHLVDEQYDEGSILFQARCHVEPDDSPEDVAAKVHELEYRYFPEVIRTWARSMGRDYSR